MRIESKKQMFTDTDSTMQEPVSSENKTDLPYGYELIDGRIVVNESEKEVVVWIFSAMERYSNDVPDILVKQLQQRFYEEYGAELGYEEAKRRVTFNAIQEYLCTELNVRLMNLKSGNKENRVEQVKESLSTPLSKEQRTLIEDRFIKGGVEYRKEIVRHIHKDSQNMEKNIPQQKSPKR